MQTTFLMSRSGFRSVRFITLFGWICCSLFSALTMSASMAAEVFPATLEFGETRLNLNGSGTRKKAFISLYQSGLYLTNPSSDATAIISADEPMAIRISIVSGFISSKKMNDALSDGFEQSTAGNTAPIAAKITAFRYGFSDEISKLDQFDLVYRPETGVEVIKNGEIKATVTGLDFKKALFGIWLSGDPIQKSLKKAMLSG